MPANRIIDIKQVEGNSITEPVDAATVKDTIRVTFNDDDNSINRMIKAARLAVENYTCTSLVSKTITAIVELNQDRHGQLIELELPHGPVIYTDATFATDITVNYKNGLKSTDYETKVLDTDFFFNGLDFPVVQFFRPGIYKFNYITGYLTVPQDLKNAIIAEVAYRYEHNGDEFDDNGICQTAMELANPHKRFKWL